jgi:hypothetical protein
MPKYLQRCDKKHGINVDGTRLGTSTHTNRLLIRVYGTGPTPPTGKEGFEYLPVISRIVSNCRTEFWK